jgi:hypothetical protein
MLPPGFRRGRNDEENMMKPALIAVLLLAACGQQPPAPANEADTVARAAKPAEPATKAFVADEKNDLIEFHYAWSAEAAAVPQLVERFRKDMAKLKAELIAGAEEDKASRGKQGVEFNGYMSSTDYKTAGQSDRLLSLSVEAGSYTGGAHGNYGVAALLWDRQAAREIKIADLFTAPANMNRLLTQRWCDALNKEREKKRGEPVGDSGLFEECPKLDEIAIIAGDRNNNGRFDTLALVASPYVAGPWVEGSYEIELGMTPELLAALKGEYRTGFEAAQTQ